MKKIIAVSLILLISSVTIYGMKNCSNERKIYIKHISHQESKDNAIYYYPMTTVVSKIDTKNDIVTVENNNGHMYEFMGVEDWEIGDICSLMLDDNGTESIYDDIIVKTIYDGKENEIR